MASCMNESTKVDQMMGIDSNDDGIMNESLNENFDGSSSSHPNNKNILHNVSAPSLYRKRTFDQTSNGSIITDGKFLLILFCVPYYLF